MTNGDNTAHDSELFSKRYDVDFLTRKSLGHLEPYDEYVL